VRIRNFITPIAIFLCIDCSDPPKDHVGHWVNDTGGMKAEVWFRSNDTYTTISTVPGRPIDVRDGKYEIVERIDKNRIIFQKYPDNGPRRTWKDTIRLIGTDRMLYSKRIFSRQP